MRIEFVRLASDSDFETLEREWRALEEDADGSFFQSWTWIGCRLRSRFADPFLVRATENGAVVALALFNRRGPPLLRTFWLHETGFPAEDSVFIEHNGPLMARGRETLLKPMLARALQHGRLILSGVNDAVRDAALSIGWCHVRATRPTPYASLNSASEADWLAKLGTSTRYQLRRSRRRYEMDGRLVVKRASNVDEGLAFLGELATLHQARWISRGHRGAFAEPAFVVFHQTLVARGLPRGEVDLLRVSVDTEAGARVIGYLYNLCWRNRIYAYQGGFDYAAASPHETPGLTCHHAAIEVAISSRFACYDFLAGEARYKTNLGNGQATLHWLDVAKTWTPYGARSIARRWLR
jgi:CelD/BcsL family acetyltransferase involved in cellulose biosynthesis